LYVYSVGDFVMIGDVYDAVRKVNLGEEMRNEKMAEALASIPESEMIIMGESTDRYVTVFTDTDCGYCQKFHQHVAELQSMGMQVRYLMFPRAGINSASYDEAVSVWCAEDQREAMTIAKAGGTVEPKVCENPVEKQYRLGQRLGVRGTPTMVLDSGKVIPGFLPPAQLLAEAEMEY
jgi:thiol:disulfide interchange protein DsbC